MKNDVKPESCAHANFGMAQGPKSGADRVACAIQRKAARVGIDPRKVHVGVVRPPCTTKEAVGL